MTADILDGERQGLVPRVRDLLIRPRSAWQRIAAEAPGPLIGAYVAPLAVMGAIAGFAGRVIAAGFAIKPALIWSGVAALLYIVFAMLGVIVAAWLINFLAKRFGAEADFGRARQLAAYSATPIFVAALAAIAPPIAAVVMAIGVVYAIVLLAMGVGRLLPPPDAENNVPRFTLTFTVVGALIFALAAAFISPVINSGREALASAVETVAPPPASPEIANRSAAELAIERLAQSYGAHLLADPARLAEQFPDTLPGGFALQSTATAEGGGVSRADATYRQGDVQLSVSIIQFAYTIDPAGGAALFDIGEDGARDNGYARSQGIDGRLFAEDVTGENVRYIVIGRGVAMIAAGAVTVDRARAAVETIDLHRLEELFGR